ncbi:Flp family type IVb pilin [Roseibium suaedae]|uniref:Pilus assembly protein Flp/PilA n=1 Tax=Roseibium suaedae TaxID=735517 RepID=A0A1M7NA73_9HYPH|nr:Flp family type IVb pilin [Roseibium suaedae]SHN00499.1 pilus assembly protein Flp/PilA [Roseibium suaedae]
MPFNSHSVRNLTRNVSAFARRFGQCESGATVIEYGLIVAMISVAITGTLLSIGQTIRDDVFTVVSNAMNNAGN